MLSLGIDIGGSSVKVAARRADGSARTGRSPSYRRPDASQLADAVRDAAAAAGVTPGEAVGSAGVCLPGVLDERREAIALSVHLPELVGVPIRKVMARALGAARTPLAYLSDANATAYDVYHSRAMTGRLFLLAMGTGVGASVVDEPGKLLFVDGDSPGHIGQCDVSLDADPPIGPDGGAGGLEAYASAGALVPRYGPDVVSACERLTAADPPLRALARAVRIAHAIYRPHHVCIAGGIGIRMAKSVPDLRRLVEVHLTSLARPNWTLVAGYSDFHAALGAARFAAAQSTTPRTA